MSAILIRSIGSSAAVRLVEHNGRQSVISICGGCGAEAAPPYTLSADDDETVVLAGMAMVADYSTARCGSREQGPRCEQIRRDKARSALSRRRVRSGGLTLVSP